MATISGQDSPGIMAALLGVLAKNKVEIVDLGQTALQKMLGLYFVLDLGGGENSADSVMKDLLFEANQLGLTLNFQLLQTRDAEKIHSHSLFVLHFFGDTASLAEISKILAEERVNIETVSSSVHHGDRSIEMVLDVRAVPDLTRLKQRIMSRARALKTDLGFQKQEAYRKNKRMIFFDMDSTLVDMEIIDELAHRAGVKREVARLTERAMRGEFDFAQSLTQRVAMLKGLKQSDLEAVRDGIRLSEGVEELVTSLKWLGFTLGIVTGGFDYFAQHLKEKLGFDLVHANSLEIKEGVLTGKVAGEIIDAAGKARVVSQTACDLGIPMDQVVVVGDGSNDALMLGQAGLGIAYNAKKGLDRIANVSLGHARFLHIFHILGITQEDVEEAVSCKQM
ncbi:MAG: phosphoserine phosphatase SerB [Deltaproteobacteria bacterium]|nr:phosphoserine phosphatase SerB [Deltaproteobacteria bacterium]